MKMLKGWIPTGIMAAVLLFATTAANAGIIIGGYANPTDETKKSDPCSVSTNLDGTGIIIGGLTGIIIGGYTGIIVTDYTTKDGGTQNCGIIIGG